MGRKHLIKLNKEALLLYDWLILSTKAEYSDVTLNEFQSWIQQHTGKPYSMEAVRAALQELEAHELVEVQSFKVKISDLDPSKFEIDSFS